MSDDFSLWKESVRVTDHRRRPAVHLDQQIELYPIRICTTFPEYPIGKDLSFLCQGADNHIYYAKDDKDGRKIRATEWMATNLAMKLGLSVAECAILEDADGNTYFGSRQPMSLSDESYCQRFLSTPLPKDELQRPSAWLGQYLARVWAFDTYIDNDDRSLRNFILDGSGRLRAIDFASSRFIQRPGTKFPIASDNTSKVGKYVRAIHGHHIESAMGLLDELRGVTASTVQGIANAMPDDWLTQDQMREFIDAWSDDRKMQRVSSAKALIEHDWNT